MIVQTRAAMILKWAVSMFGPVALNRDERAARVLEEALELAQCEGVSVEVAERLVNVVYSKPPGDLRQEVAGLQLCLDALCANIGVNSDTECDVEFIRVSQWPKEYWKRKHDTKIANGVANLSEPIPPKNFGIVDIQGHGTYYDTARSKAEALTLSDEEYAKRRIPMEGPIGRTQHPSADFGDDPIRGLPPMASREDE